MKDFQLGTFNTLSQNESSVGGGFPVWARVNKTYQGGGYIDAGGLKAGTVIPAGTMVRFNGAGKEVEIITGDAGQALVTVFVGTAATAAGDITLDLAGTSYTASVEEGASAEEIASAIGAAVSGGWDAEVDGTVVKLLQQEAAAVEELSLDMGESGAEAKVELTRQGVAEGGELGQVNGLIFNDVCIPDGCTLATCAVVYDGRIYADRVPGGLPEEIEAQLPAIEFVREA